MPKPTVFEFKQQLFAKMPMFQNPQQYFTSAYDIHNQGYIRQMLETLINRSAAICALAPNDPITDFFPYYFNLLLTNEWPTIEEKYQLDRKWVGHYWQPVHDYLSTLLGPEDTAKRGARRLVNFEASASEQNVADAAVRAPPSGALSAPRQRRASLGDAPSIMRTSPLLAAQSLPNVLGSSMIKQMPPLPPRHHLPSRPLATDDDFLSAVAAGVKHIDPLTSAALLANSSPIASCVGDADRLAPGSPFHRITSDAYSPGGKGHRTLSQQLATTSSKKCKSYPDMAPYLKTLFEGQPAQITLPAANSAKLGGILDHSLLQSNIQPYIFLHQTSSDRPINFPNFASAQAYIQSQLQIYYGLQGSVNMAYYACLLTGILYDISYYNPCLIAFELIKQYLANQHIYLLKFVPLLATFFMVNLLPGNGFELQLNVAVTDMLDNENRLLVQRDDTPLLTLKIHCQITLPEFSAQNSAPTVEILRCAFETSTVVSVVLPAVEQYITALTNTEIFPTSILEKVKRKYGMQQEVLQHIVPPSLEKVESKVQGSASQKILPFSTLDCFLPWEVWSIDTKKLLPHLNKDVLAFVHSCDLEQFDGQTKGGEPPISASQHVEAIVKIDLCRAVNLSMLPVPKNYANWNDYLSQKQPFNDWASFLHVCNSLGMLPEAIKELKFSIGQGLLNPFYELLLASNQRQLCEQNILFIPDTLDDSKHFHWCQRPDQSFYLYCHTSCVGISKCDPLIEVMWSDCVYHLLSIVNLVPGPRPWQENSCILLAPPLLKYLREQALYQPFHALIQTMSQKPYKFESFFLLLYQRQRQKDQGLLPIYGYEYYIDKQLITLQSYHQPVVNPNYTALACVLARDEAEINTFLKRLTQNSIASNQSVAAVLDHCAGKMIVKHFSARGGLATDSCFKSLPAHMQEWIAAPAPLQLDLESRYGLFCFLSQLQKDHKLYDYYLDYLQCVGLFAARWVYWFRHEQGARCELNWVSDFKRPPLENLVNVFVMVDKDSNYFQLTIKNEE